MDRYLKEIFIKLPQVYPFKIENERVLRLNFKTHIHVFDDTVLHHAVTEETVKAKI